jgi:hypothetical protein
MNDSPQSQKLVLVIQLTISMMDDYWCLMMWMIFYKGSEIEAAWGT